MMRRLCPFFIFLSLVAPNAHAAGLTSAQLLAELGDSIDRAAFERGEIVGTGFSDRESKRALVAAMLVQVPAPLSEVVKALQSDPTLQMGVSLPMENPTDWQAVQAVIKSRLTDRERELLTDKDAADNFNLSAAELSQLRKEARNVDALAAAWRTALQTRAQQYRAKGAVAITPYMLSDGAVIAPGRQLDEAIASMTFLRKHYPGFFDSIQKYPLVAAALAQQHVFSIDQESGRSLFLLKHTLVQMDTDHALIAERRYYISHTLDALQVVILCLPTEKGTLVGMLNNTYTGRVAGFGRAIAHRIGREKMQEKVRPMFVGLQKRFSVGAP